MSNAPEIQYHEHGRFRVVGGIIPNAKTAYCTYGDPKNPCIVFPTCYGGHLDSQEYMIGADKMLDPTKYFIVIPALFCNGESSSPSNTPAPYNGPYFPAVSYEDNVRAHHELLLKLGVTKVHCAIGFSMGAQTAYYWAVMYPDFVDKYVVLCGSARTSPHNICFLEGPKAALVASKDFDNGHYTATPQHGIRAFGRAYSAWAYGQTWYREHGYLHGGKHTSLETFLREEWEEDFLVSWDANDMLALLHTWQQGDVSLIRDNGDYVACLRAIQAKGLIMPCRTDLYFAPEDSEIEMGHLGNTARLVVIESIWGHMAGGGNNEKDDAFIKAQVLAFLDEA
ncbi:homoserine O-acetyltransferase [Athelia psychrophila]|uniref:Homoserine O-acetyltransferase n=1 Tax=Athelia psychrophila TaxID=1759441 RepID=A0A166XCR4_9AGAM|nr:homoserine O-acetyltransferase [Fibularhizoctonia sp. CBS 109695]